MGGLSSVAHTTLVNPGQFPYKEIESSIVRYDYDPRAAAANLDAMGLTKGTDGFYQDGGQKIPIDVFTSTSQDTKGRAMLAIVDSWQQLGLNAQPVIFPVTQISDREFLMTRPGFYHVRHPHNLMNMAAYWTGPGIGVADNHFTGNNYARYRNAELESLVSQFNVTIPIPPRIEVLKQVVHHITDQVVILGLFYDVEVTAIGNRMKDVSGRGEGITKNWDAYLWDIQGS
jgi:ABC-type transport system substrate-binding protein